MDGTLLDTEVLARACFERACADFVWQVESAIYDRCVGTTWEATERILRAALGPEFPYEVVAARWTEHYHAHVHHHPVPLKPGIETVLARLAELAVPMAIATSSHRPTVETKLALAGIDHHFELLVCGGETSRGKPHADPYLAATRGLDLSTAVCWAVEDSDNGVRAAHAAGLIVFQIPDEMAPSKEVAQLGHEILVSALELMPKLG